SSSRLFVFSRLHFSSLSPVATEIFPLLRPWGPSGEHSPLRTLCSGAMLFTASQRIQMELSGSQPISGGIHILFWHTAGEISPSLCIRGFTFPNQREIGTSLRLRTRRIRPSGSHFQPES